MEALLDDPTITSAEKLYVKAKSANLKVTRKQVADFWRKQSSVQIVRGRPASTEQKKINCWTGNIGCVQIDLMDISKYKGFNGQKTFLFNAVDIHSRRAWSFPIANKRPDTILPHMQKVVADYRSTCPDCLITVSSDDGNEWRGSMDAWLRREGIERIETTHKQSMAIVERFNQTLWKNLNLSYFSKNQFRFVGDLPRLIRAYNEDYVHSGIKQKPIEVWNKVRLPSHALVPEFDLTKPDGDAPLQEAVKIGDRVRRQTNRKIFDKPSASTRYSQEIYEVVGRKHNRYVLKNVANGDTLDSAYLARELSIANEPAPARIRAEPRERLIRQNRVRRLNRREPAFNDREHQVNDRGVVKTKKRLVAVGKRRSKAPVRFRGDGIDFF